MGKYGLTSGMIPQKYAHTIGGDLIESKVRWGPPNIHWTGYVRIAF